VAAADRSIGRWLKFLLLPILLAAVLDSVVAAVLGGFAHLDRDNLTSRATFLGAYWLVGRCMGGMAPAGSRRLAVAYAIAFGAFNLYLGYTTDGSTVRLYGQTVTQHLSWIDEVLRLVGLLLGVTMAPRTSAVRLPREV
jgi:hypothetical protein